MKAMHVLQFVLLATILFLELVYKLVLFGGFFPRTAIFSPSHSDRSDNPQFVVSSHDSCMVKIGICYGFTSVACYLHWL
jgi:hypothetical protein